MNSNVKRYLADARANAHENFANADGQFDDASIARALNLIESYGLASEPFIQTIEQFKQ